MGICSFILLKEQTMSYLGLIRLALSRERKEARPREEQWWRLRTVALTMMAVVLGMVDGSSFFHLFVLHMRRGARRRRTRARRQRWRSKNALSFFLSISFSLSLFKGVSVHENWSTPYSHFIVERCLNRSYSLPCRLD